MRAGRHALSFFWSTVAFELQSSYYTVSDKQLHKLFKQTGCVSQLQLFLFLFTDELPISVRGETSSKQLSRNGLLRHYTS